MATLMVKPHKRFHPTAHTRNYFTCQKANEDILTTKTDYKASNEQRIRVIFYCQLGILSRFNYHACNDQ